MAKCYANLTNFVENFVSRRIQFCTTHSKHIYSSIQRLQKASAVGHAQLVSDAPRVMENTGLTQYSPNML